MWNFGLINPNADNLGVETVAMAFALSTVQEIELKNKVALVGSQEILWILRIEVIPP